MTGYSLQKFVSIHSSVYNHVNLERRINTRIRFKQKRDVALREWRDLLVAWQLLPRENRRRVRIRLTAPARAPGESLAHSCFRTYPNLPYKFTATLFARTSIFLS
jgi:hypothetical protein